jgi:hypothetical protein
MGKIHTLEAIGVGAGLDGSPFDVCKPPKRGGCREFHYASAPL